MEYVRCGCVWLGAAWMRGLGLGFTHPVGMGGGVLDVCLCFGCGGVGRVGVGRGLGPTSGWVGGVMSV